MKYVQEHREAKILALRKNNEYKWAVCFSYQIQHTAKGRPCDLSFVCFETVLTVTAP